MVASNGTAIAAAGGFLRQNSDSTPVSTPTQPQFVSVNELLDYRIRSQPNAVALCFGRIGTDGHDAAKTIAFDKVTYAQLDRYVCAAARHYAHQPGLAPRRIGAKVKTIGLLARSGLEYVVTEMALCRL